MKPKISIITPSYNQAQFIERTILSVLNQNYPNLEYIIIDGGSTDGSVEIIKKYENRLTYWVSEKDKGTYDANNKALARITGDYWCVVNSDDCLVDGVLNKISQVIIQHPNEKWIVGGVRFIDENDNIQGGEIPVKPASINGYTFLHGCWISHPTVFLHKTLIEEIGYFNKYHLMDMDYWLRLEKNNYKPYVWNEYVASLRDHKDCKSADRIKLQEEYLKVYENFVVANGITNNIEVKKKTRYNFIVYYKMKISFLLVKNDRKSTLKYLYKLLMITPSLFWSKWYLGALKRWMFGLSDNDPLKKQFPDVVNNGNWN